MKRELKTLDDLKQEHRMENQTSNPMYGFVKVKEYQQIMGMGVSQ